MLSRFLSPSRKYYWRIIKWISAAVLLVIIVLSSTVYLNSQQIMLKKEYEYNKKVFEQVKINIDLMDSMANNLCKSLYLNADVGVVMYARKEDVVEEAIRINRIYSTSLSVNPYIHSITIYNNYLDKFYNAGTPIFFDDKQLVEMINGKKDIPKLKAVYRNIGKVVNGQTIPENVFSYFMYSNMESTGYMDGAITVNVRTDWLLGNIKYINGIEREQGDYVFVLDAGNEYIEAGQENIKIQEWLKNQYFKNADKVSEDGYVGFFEGKFDNIGYFVTYTYIKSMNITILKVQRLSEIYSSIDHLRTSIAVITLIFFVAAVLVSTGISRKIYNPVGELFQMISSDRSQTAECGGNMDEISYLNNYYKTTMQKLNVYEKERYLNRDIMKKYWLGKLLEESHTIDYKKTKVIFEEGSLSLCEKENMAVLVMKIDNHQAFMNEFVPKDRELLRFAIMNIASEVIGRRYRNEGAAMDEGHIAYIIGIPAGEEGYQEYLVSLINEIQKHIKQYFKLSVSVSLSKATDDICSITSIYNKTFDNLSYKLKLGHSCIVLPEFIEKEEVHRENYDIKELETQLVERIKSKDLSGVEEIMALIFKEISQMAYERILITVISTSSVINTAVYNVRIPGVKHINFDLNTLYHNIMEKETLEEIYTVIIERLRYILRDNEDTSEKSKDRYIANAVRDYIDKNYLDYSLSLTGISSIMNISARRLSKIFKDEMGIFIPDYINEVRLLRAAELLENSPANINEIMTKVGIENESYFYRIFKKKFGLTPKEYGFKRIINMAGNKM